MRTKRVFPHKYRCKWCRQAVVRLSDKAWIKSWCDRTGRDVHLMRVKERRAAK